MKQNKEKEEPVAEDVQKNPVEEQEVEAIQKAVEGIPVAEQKRKRDTEQERGPWTPKTDLGKKVFSGEIANIDEILNKGLKILEPEIVDHLLQLETELLLIGQSKGKFGGGQRRIFRQTQKKTKEGNKPKFSTLAIAGDRNGHVGIGFGKSKETVPAREKAIRNAKMNIFKIERGSGSWESEISEPHSIPFAVEGKCSSVTIKLMPAPKGKGLIVEKECAKLLELAGIKDVWSKSRGQTRNKINMILACEKALKQLSSMKINKFDKFKNMPVEAIIGEEKQNE
ncbi:MAG: 30S ribosomal protein S5 [Candidatus Woesearchaeota archaeon]